MSSKNSAILLALGLVLGTDLYASDSNADDQLVSRVASSQTEFEPAADPRTETAEQQLVQQPRGYACKPEDFPSFNEWKREQGISDIKTARGKGWHETLTKYGMSEQKATSWVTSYGNYRGIGVKERAQDKKDYEIARERAYLRFLSEQAPKLTPAEVTSAKVTAMPVTLMSYDDEGRPCQVEMVGYTFPAK